MVKKRMETRLLSEPEFKATFGPRMIDITGQEDSVSPEGVLDVDPYVDAVPQTDLEPHALNGRSVEWVWRSSDKRFDHVLFGTTTKNVYLVVVVDLKKDCVKGHRILDLDKEYGLGAGAPLFCQ